MINIEPEKMIEEPKEVIDLDMIDSKVEHSITIDDFGP